MGLLYSVIRFAIAMCVRSVHSCFYHAFVELMCALLDAPLRCFNYPAFTHHGLRVHMQILVPGIGDIPI